MHRSLNELATAVNARQSVRKEMWACCAIMRVGAFQVSDWIMSECRSCGSVAMGRRFGVAFCWEIIPVDYNGT